MNYKIIIGIDPDIKRSGIAILEKETKKISVFNYQFPFIVEFFQKICDKKSDILVVVEAGWLNSISNYHGEVSKVGQRIAKNVGSNHQTGKHIVEMAKHYGLNVELQKPFIKCWKGPEGKITHDEIKSFTGITFPTNQETRDAILIAWIVAGFPIKIKK